MPRTRNTRSHRGSAEPAKHPLQDITHRYLGGGESSKAKNPPRKKSPLPPSSPPSASSHLEYVSSDHNPKEFMLQTRVGSSPKSNDSDPFGFFAVEKKLKAKRVAAPPRKLHKLRAPLEVTHVEYDHYPRTPKTPKKQRIRPRESGALPLSEVFQDTPTFPAFDFGADPGTPSPSKPHPRVDKGKAKAERGLSDKENEPPMTTSPSKEEPTLRRSTRRKSAAAVAAPVKEETKASPPKKKARSTSSKPRKTVTRKKPVKSKKVKEDPDAQEKQDRERQKRIEYFKKLDKYEIAKENVYVV